MDAGTTERKKQMDGQEKMRFGRRFAREISLWALLAKGSIYKILSILVIMSVAEGYLFYRSLNRSLQQATLVNAGFEPVLNYSGAAIVFLAALCLTFVVLLRCVTEHDGSIFSYTLERLLVTNRHLTMVKLVYNILCFVLLIGTQVWVGLWMCRLYAARMPEELVSPQLVFLAFYRSPLLHNILPLADGAKWVRNLLMILALSAELAVSRTRFPQAYALLSLAVMWLVSDIGSGVDFVADVLCAFVILDAVLQFLGIWKVDKSVQEE